MIKIILLVLALLAGYWFLSGHKEEQVAVEKEQREQQIMEKQQQFLQQNKDLGKQMQGDLEQRMQDQ